MRRFAPVCVMFFAATALAQSETSVASQPAAAPPTEDAIVAAKRDFNALKATRGNPDPSTKLTMPSLTTPELQLGSALPLPRTSSKPEATADKKSANWLVDAMMKPNEKDPRDSHARSLEGKTVLAEDDAVTQQSGRGGASTGREIAVPAEKRIGPEFNPLASYMAGWMSPQDYALLKPGLSGVTAADLASRGDPSLPAANLNPAAVGDAGSALDLRPANKPAAFALPKPADNPFLQSFNSSSASVAPAFSPAPTSNPVPTTSAFTTPAINDSPARSRIPDFAKPSTDEKYFKQLKRF